MMSAFRTTLTFLLPVLLFTTLPQSVLAGSFSDVPESHEAFTAIEYLKEKGIIGGYPDGTFKPDRGVNRAEAVKFVVGPLVTEDQLATTGESPFSDVPVDAWFRPYVEYARVVLRIVDGPPAKPGFKGVDPVLKVEFLKMLLLAHKSDPNAYGEIQIPLSADVTDPNAWFYPYVRKGIATSMLIADNNKLYHPGKQLTRGEVSLLVYRFLMYKENRRTQALLNNTEAEIITILEALDENDIESAEYASARALVAARGALSARPESAVVKGALRITEAFRALVRAYRAGLNLQLEDVIALSGEAWRLSDDAVTINPDLRAIGEQVKAGAKSMADSARTLNGE